MIEDELNKILVRPECRRKPLLMTCKVYTRIISSVYKIRVDDEGQLKFIMMIIMLADFNSVSAVCCKELKLVKFQHLELENEVFYTNNLVNSGLIIDFTNT